MSAYLGNFKFNIKYIIKKNEMMNKSIKSNSILEYLIKMVIVLTTLVMLSILESNIFPYIAQLVL